MKPVFYEVLNDKGRWMANYSPLLEKTCATPAFDMARITAIHSHGEIYAVGEDGQRTFVWPKRAIN